MHLRHARQSRQVLAVDASEVFGPFGDDLEDVIRRSRHQVAFEHVGDARDRLFKGLQHFVGLALQRDLNEYGGGHAHLARIQQRHVVSDISRLFQALHPPVTGRG